MPDLADALIHVPRHHFIPSQAWAAPAGAAGGHWIDRNDDPGRWWKAVYSDTVIVTQLDEGRTELTLRARRPGRRHRRARRPAHAW